MLLPFALVLCLQVSPHPAPRTLRVDTFHTGQADKERFSLDRLVLEPLPWPGNPERPLDDTQLGLYRLEVRDAKSHRLLYSRGFASIFGEWQTTAEARKQEGGFHESFRIPAPTAPVELLIQKRDAHMRFRELQRFVVDPKDPTLDPSSPPAPGPLLTLMENGPPAKKLDLLILGDGYTEEECPRFEAQARKGLKALFEHAPFKERKNDFNVWALCPASRQSGVARPSLGMALRSPLGVRFDAFGSERYVLSFDNRAVREAAAFAPYDALVLFANSETYGGGGIFNLYSTVSAGSQWANYLFVHELAHHLAGLADEYFTSEPTYLPQTSRVEPWEPNVTALLKGAPLKWKKLLSPQTPLPTPWDKAAFEVHGREIQAKRKRIRAEQRPEAEMDALFFETQTWETAFFRRQAQAGKVGAFEGASYQSHGLYRPQLDCVMFSRNEVPFCAACQQALNQVIDLYSRPASKP